MIRQPLFVLGIQRRKLLLLDLGAVYKGRPANGEGGWFLNFGHSRTGGGGVVCESSDVRKLLKKSKFQNLKLKLEIIIDRDSNMRAFTYDVCSNLGVGK